MRRASLPALAFLAVSAAVPSLWAAEAPAAALPRPRVRIVLNAMGSFTNPSFSDTQHYAEYAETTSVTSSYSTKTGFGPDVALELRLFGGFGVLAGYSLASRSEDGHFEAQRPQPLYLNRPRSVSGELTGYDYKEGAVHLDLAYAGASGKLDWSLFAGASLFQVEADLLGQLTWNEAYPYDEVSVASSPAKTVKASPTGFNVGARLDWRFARRFGAGLVVRYSSASVKLRATPDASETSFDAGGLQAGLGVRLYF
jgi:hypothetical protein